MHIPVEHTLGFLAGGYKNVAKFKGLDPKEFLPGYEAKPLTSMVIGWDAADWRPIKELLGQGKMPQLAEFMSTGVHSRLATLDPPISPMLWTSIATSRWPSDHGIHGFTELQAGNIRAVRSTSINCPTYWELLERMNCASSVVAWWPSHPVTPSKFGAGRVSNLAFGAPQFLDQGIHPGSLREKAKKLLLRPEEIPAAALALFFPHAELTGEDDIARAALKILVHALNVQTLTTLVLDHQQEGGHASVYFDALDHFKHLGMKYMAPPLTGVSSEEVQNYGKVVEGAYRLHDLFLDALLSFTNAESSVFLVSDHGFVHGSERISSLPVHAGAPALEHQHFGIFVSRSPYWNRQIKVSGLTLMDIAPLVLAAHGYLPLENFEGKLPIGWIKNKGLMNVKADDKATPDAPLEVLESDVQLLQQLVALGYLEPEHVQIPKGQGDRIAENHYYLARSLRAQGKLDQAWRELWSLISSSNKVPERYAVLGASLLHDTKQWSELGRWIAKYGQNSTLRIWNYYQHVVDMSQNNRPNWPPEVFQKLDVGTAVLWGKLMVRVADFAALQSLLSHQNMTHPDLLNLKVRLNLHLESWPVAAEAAMESLELAYHQPQIHGALAHCLFKLGQREEAQRALQIQQMLQIKRAVPPLFVVTGAPRSGTSLGMQILEAGGVVPVTDQQRVPDDFNVRGYYEHNKVKDWELTSQWLEKERGKAIKIVLPLLRNAPLPEGPLVVVRMRRAPLAVAQSQRKMVGAQSAPLGWNESEKWMKEWRQTLILLNMRPQTTVVELDYEDCLAVAGGASLGQDFSTQFSAQLSTLNDHLPQPVTEKVLQRVVDVSLRHF